MQVVWIIFSAYVLLRNRSGTFANSNDCAPKDYGQGSVVCVCDKNHCDTIEPLEESIPDGQYVQYVSDKKGLRMKKSTGKMEQVAATKNASIVTIDSSVEYQSIVGWGGAFTDSAGINVKALSEDVQEKLLRAYFADEGLQYSLCRVPIGGTDFSTRPYAYAEVKNDWNLTSFELSREDFLYKIPLIQAANNYSTHGFKLIGSAWSAPTWMKINDDLRGLGFLKEMCYQVWANYHIKFLEAYLKNGIKFWGLTTGNEPINGLLPVKTINTMGWTPNMINKWIKENIGPTLKNSSFKDIKILTLDDQRFFLPWWIDLMFRDQEVKELVDGIAIHWYFDRIFPANLLTETHNSYPEKMIINTEACVGAGLFVKSVLLGSWERAEIYGIDITENINHWSAGWIDWNIALDLQGGPNWVKNFVDSPIIVNATANEFYKQPLFYVMGHCSKFVPPHSRRIKHEFQPPNGINLMTFIRPDGKKVVVILNSSDEDVTISVKDADKIINVNTGKHSIQTILY